jgi:alanyl-tRNA synthetase
VRKVSLKLAYPIPCSLGDWIDFRNVTERLYYTDPYLTDFDADVIDVQQADGRTGIVLDRTAFYPTSGGQPFDLGTIANARVVDVVDTDSGTIVHVIDGPAPAGRVSGHVQWDRRFDHMQQHTGQHVLSAAFDRLHDVRTVSFHLGPEVSTIDLVREVTPQEIEQAEDLANQVVWENRAVAIRFVNADEAAQLPLRKESSRAGTLRIIDIDGFDVSACGGTHVARTGALGTIAVTSWERFKGGSRLEFRCGIRAVRALRTSRDTIAGAIRLLSVAPQELPQAIERLQNDNKDLKKRSKDLESRLAVHEAGAVAARAREVNGIQTVVESLDGFDMNALKIVAQTIASRPGHAAVLINTTSPLSIVIARASDVTLDAAALLKQLTTRFGGKGGGRPALAQGGGLNATAEDALIAARSLLGL